MEAAGAALVPVPELWLGAARISVPCGAELRVFRRKGSRERVWCLSDGICWR